ncbi:MAG: hypothetical protein A2725_04135 [Candidatus Magasanikbacteria bacterium RIFCSPHIGHO2_01_FULL_33_34]|uniref:Copper-sensing transcriptional repressor CsoR n=1 Tax=Candidatus Magasanikbacteria bacterium RIFCSPHIGHO2_01_FULL_33_34 TaxID=1798671 RepID=A0A1F6LHN2_9BACT|nr:MAG: hypothetical protein A2725_04135 [Candidatus Magasanikbacteria bacterium RIFCSPHIGHO2_01_FULL_33_34]OGH65155.1 MAG: hypothetical protein A3B83_03895 [Candidatus Magasanikbacteria bacterium RIFCSPHIGHO2_02_FULL_33_17]OGH75301.1 MAG: hypothetical protein A3A89_04270 [Candidatus Magasanikbacteria bacterium RIFCSPLOWO2_01_FULL_33_34]OGH81721.1 MAG: hypothetical protein A3F93_03170 [Candidatus Magasanikbacteria bacterium RIFCSPLOWO2_12_FULL_34_7]
MSEKKKSPIVNFKKAQSLLNKIIKMKEDGKYCIDIMQQNLAVIGLLKSANQKIMEQHLKTCFKSAMISKNKKKQEEKIKEILKVTKFNK